MNDSRDFQDAESVRSGHSHVTSQPVSFPTFKILAECSAVRWECRAATTSHQVLVTRMVYREMFLQIQRRLLQHLIRKNPIHRFLMCRNQFTHHRLGRMRIKHQFRIRDASQDRQPEIHSSLVRKNFQRMMDQTNIGCRFQILILTNSLTQQHSLVGR